MSEFMRILRWDIVVCLIWGGICGGVSRSDKLALTIQVFAASVAYIVFWRVLLLCCGKVTDLKANPLWLGELAAATAGGLILVLTMLSRVCFGKTEGYDVVYELWYYTTPPSYVLVFVLYWGAR